MKHTINASDDNLDLKFTGRSLVCSYIPIKLNLPYNLHRLYEVKGYYFLYEILNEFGNVYFKNSWNVRHVFARYLEPFKKDFFENGIIDTRKKILQPPATRSLTQKNNGNNKGVIHLWGGEKPIYEVHTRNGGLTYNSHEHAKKKWEEEKPYLIQKYKKEYEMWLKKKDIINLILNCLQSGDLVAFFYDQKRPYLKEIEPHYWHQDNMIGNLWIEYDVNSYEQPRFLDGLGLNDYGYVVFERKNVQKVLKLLKPKKVENSNISENLHLQFYRQYHQEQIKKFRADEIRWPSSSQINEEMALKEIMLNNGHVLRRNQFRKARRHILTYLTSKFPSNKKSDSDRKCLKNFYNSQS